MAALQAPAQVGSELRGPVPAWGIKIPGWTKPSIRAAARDGPPRVPRRQARHNSNSRLDRPQWPSVLPCGLVLILLWDRRLMEKFFQLRAENFGPLEATVFRRRECWPSIEAASKSGHLMSG